MQTTNLKTALKVVEFKSYAKAGQALRLSPIAVVQQVQSVERELGFCLFRSDSFELTGKGATFLFFASQAVQLLEEGVLEAIEKG